MLKKYARRVLLPLLFSFCCVFSGFLSVKSYAYSGDAENSFPIVWDIPTVPYSFREFNNYSNMLVNSTLSSGTNNSYLFKNPAVSNVGNIAISGSVEDFEFMYAPELYDYYFLASIYGSATSSSQFSYMPNGMEFISKDCTHGWVQHVLEDYRVYHHDTNTQIGFTVFGKIPQLDNDDLIGFNFYNNQKGGTVPANLEFEGLYFAILKNNDNSDALLAQILSKLNDVNNSINTNGSNIQSTINQASQEIQNIIDEQYSIEDNENFGVDDVITQHNEKMGVLSFGSDVMVQFLDMFQSANAGTAELTLPGFNITVQNVEYQVWPDYSFDFNQIDTWVPGLMSIVRVILPAFVWLKVLGYCITVFEKNFLSNNGG